VEISVPAPDGRTLAVYEGGARGGAPIFSLGGTPSSGQLYAPHARLAEEQGIRLIGYDRPGYGGSTPQPGRTIGNAAGDVAAIADALEIERFAVWGVSGGGPHALACAALLPERVAAAASLAGVAPFEAEGLDWLAGMGESNVEEFETVLRGREALAPLLEAEARAYVSSDREARLEALRSLLSPVDADAFSGDLGDYFFESAKTAFAHGAEGWIDDDLAFAEPWGFDVAEIRVPVLVWQGREDRFVPYTHGEWLAAHIPGAEARLAEEDGHLTLLTERIRDVHEWLLERL
jgi:pimeloyl-ACP methyl ester carboxylesterase